MRAPESRVPLHRLSYGRFTTGEIHWTLLSLMVSDGHSKNLFRDDRTPAVTSDAKIIRNALQR